jgi:hypothetical protein
LTDKEQGEAMPLTEQSVRSLQESMDKLPGRIAMAVRFGQGGGSLGQFWMGDAGKSKRLEGLQNLAGGLTGLVPGMGGLAQGIQQGRQITAGLKGIFGKREEEQAAQPRLEPPSQFQRAPLEPPMAKVAPEPPLAKIAAEPPLAKAAAEPPLARVAPEPPLAKVAPEPPMASPAPSYGGKGGDAKGESGQQLLRELVDIGKVTKDLLMTIKDGIGEMKADGKGASTAGQSTSQAQQTVASSASRRVPTMPASAMNTLITRLRSG